MKVKKKCPECREPLTVPGNIFTEVTCPSCGTGLQVDYGAFTEMGSPSRFSPESRQGRDFASVAWLLRGLFNSVPGVLRFEEERLCYSALNSGTLWKLGLRKLERQTGVPGLADRLNRGEPTPLFDIPLGEIQRVSFPWLYFSTGMHLRADGRKYRLSFIRPNNTRMPVINRRGVMGAAGKSVQTVRNIKEAVEVGERWKVLLKEIGKSSHYEGKY